MRQSKWSGISLLSNTVKTLPVQADTRTATRVYRQWALLLITADPSHGAIVTPEVEVIAAKLNSKIQIARFPGVGHHVRFAAHAAYMRCIRSFLEHI